MKGWQVAVVTAFGRGETLALELHERGFNVKVVDLTPAFSSSYHRGAGPFPIVQKSYLPAQRDLFKRTRPMTEGLTLWLKDGPLELNGPMTDIHRENSPALRAWKTGQRSSDFTQAWLVRWLNQWASPVYKEVWSKSDASYFPANQPLSLVPVADEARVMSFEWLTGMAVEVWSTRTIKDVRTENGRITDIEIENNGTRVVEADQWIWCLSSHETHMLAPAVADKIFWRGTIEPEWCWLAFDCTMKTGPWLQGWPDYSVLIGDIYLPWVYSNAAVLRRLEGDRLRVWLKVPFARAEDIDARRGWALGIENLLRSHLPAADFKVDSSAWQLCPNSLIFAEDALSQGGGKWKNWDWISPENLPRVDMAARLEREAECFERLIVWQSEQIRKQRGRRDTALHAP
jgi:hypothetical protein